MYENNVHNTDYITIEDYENSKYSYLKTQLQSLDNFCAGTCILSASLWYINILLYFYRKQ